MTTPRPVHRYVLGAVALAMVAAFAFYHRLGRSPIMPFDESLYAVNAVEMAESGNWLVVTRDHVPDFANTKPPLGIAAMALSIRWLGVNELAVRLPTALFATATLALVAGFAALRLRDPRGGLLAGFVLLATPGWVANHAARTADLDVLLALLVLATALAWFGYVQRPTRAGLVRFSLALGLALLAKSVAALLAMPGLLAWAAGVRGARFVFSVRHAIALLAACGPWIGYVAAHEAATPGYAWSVGITDFWLRVTTPYEGHVGRPLYYLRELADERFFPWVFLLPPALLVAGRDPDPERRRFAALAAAFVASWLAALMLVRTKLWWYLVPVYPMAALALGVGASGAVELARRRLGRAGVLGVALVTGVAFAAVPYPAIVGTVLHGEEMWPYAPGERRELHHRDQLHLLAVALPPGAAVQVLVEAPLSGLTDWSDSDRIARFYAAYFRERGRTVRVVDTRTVRPEGWVMTCLDTMEPALASLPGGRRVLPGPCATFRFEP